MKVTVRLKLNEDEWEDVRKHKEFRHIAPLSYCRESVSYTHLTLPTN